VGRGSFKHVAELFLFVHTLLAFQCVLFWKCVETAVAARGGMETLRPALQRLYMTRASAYKDALKGFIEGYQEGIQQVMEHKQKEESELLKKEFESLKAGIREVVEQKKKEESEWLKEDGSKKSEEHELQKHEENNSKKTN